MQLDPHHLEQLSVILEEGTLQRAADTLGTSQPALSRMLRAIEARIGAALFERSTRPLTPTELGLELAQQGRTIRTARLRAAELVELSARGVAGILKVGAPPFMCRNLMSEAIASFLASRPKVRINLIPDYRDGLLERLDRNQIDILIGPSRFAAYSEAELDFDQMHFDAMVIVGRDNNPLMSLHNPTPSDFEDQTWVGLPDRSMLRQDMEEALNLLRIKRHRIGLQSDSPDAVLQVLRETDFLTMLPRYAVRGDGGDGLAVAPLELPNRQHDISAITLTGRPVSKLTSDFRDHLKAQFALLADVGQGMT